jgi:hypothetical protein
MPLYFFDIIEDGRTNYDIHGETLASQEEASREAGYGAMIVAQERLTEGHGGTVEIQIKDQNGTLLGRAQASFCGGERGVPIH